MTDLQKITDTPTLPLYKTILEDLAAVIGFTATCRLAAWFGDSPTHLYVPVKAEPGSTLVMLIGMPAAKRLCAEWPAEKLSVPRLRDYEDDSRKRTVARMLEQRFSTREVSVVMRISERRVQQICQELELYGLIDPVGPVKNDTEKSQAKSPLEITPPTGYHEDEDEGTVSMQVTLDGAVYTGLVKRKAVRTKIRLAVGERAAARRQAMASAKGVKAKPLVKRSATKKGAKK